MSSLRRPIFVTLLSLGVVLPSGRAQSNPVSDGSSKRDEIWKPGVRDETHPGRWQRAFDARKRRWSAAKGRVEGVLALLGLLAELEGEVETTKLDAFLDEAASAKTRDPELRSFAAYVQGRLWEDTGRHEAARKRFAAQGYLGEWMLLGPFDLDKDGDFDEALAPEGADFDEAQSFEGKLPRESLRWQTHGADDAGGGAFVSLDEFLHPNLEVIGYANSFVYLPKATRARLTIGTGGPYRIFVDGLKVGEGDAQRSPDPLQDSYGVELEAGWHRVLVKLAADEGVWGMYLRLSDDAGAPIEGLRQELRLPEGASVGAAKLRSSRAGLRAAMERRAAGKGRSKAAAKLELAEFYRWVRPFDRDDESALAVAREAEDELSNSRAAMAVAALASDDVTARDAIERAVTRARKEGDDARLGELLLELHWRHQSLGLEARAREMLDEARRLAPDDALVEMTALEQLSDDGFALAALRWIEDLQARYPNSASITRARAGRLMDLGRVREGLALLEKLDDAGFADGAIAHARIRAHLDLGELDAAREIARKLADAHPGRPGVYEDLATLYATRGEHEAAIEAIERAISLAPQDAELHRRKGELLSRAGMREASVLAFERSLELFPQQPDLQDLLASYGSAGGEDVFSVHGLDLERELAAFEKAGRPASWKGKEAGVIRHRVAQRVFDNGLGERLDHRIIAILDDRGVRSQAVQAFTYDPSESYVEVRRARVRHPDGSTEELGETHAYSLAAAGYRMYYDQRQLQVDFQGLAAGDVVEVAFVRRDVAARNLFDEYYGDLVPLEDMVPIAHFDYLLDAPREMKLFFNRPVKSEDLPQAEGQKVAYRRHRLERKGVPAVVPEGGMPGWTEVLEHLHVSTYGDWDAVARWYWGLVREQLVSDAAIREGVQKALAELPSGADRRAQADAIYRHVIRSTRYVGLEFGIHGYKPYKTTEVYERRFGDCKDKASLLKVMLAEIGVKAHLVLVRTRDQGRIEAKPASLSAFNHAIVYVPEFDLYLDGTAEWSGADELPGGDQGASVLIVEDGKGGRFTQIPFSRPQDNRTEIRETVVLSKSGEAQLGHQMELVGSGASSWRASFQAKDDQREKLTKQLGARIPGARVTEHRFVDIDDPLAPVQLSYEAEVPTWSKQASAGAAFRFRVTGRGSDLARRFAPLASRRHDLELSVPTRETRRVEYRLPRGYDFTRVPESRRLENPYGRFELEVERKEGGAVVQTSFELTKHRVPAADYPAFREFLRQVDAAMEQSFEYEVAQ